MIVREFVLSVVTEAKFPHPESDVGNLFAGRIWNMDGVVHAECERLGADRVVISRAEYDQLRALKNHEKR